MYKEWKVAIYARVSTDKKNQQESIPAQIGSLEKWIKDKNNESRDTIYSLIEVYEDLGFSGSNFDRESFRRMEEDIDNGKINMVLTRDLSRFGRNYITAGYYIEDYFKVKGVRFVSVLDNVDTIHEVDDIVPFKNILNEMYIKDCSRRTKDGLLQRMLRGSYIASKPLYGYKVVEEYKGSVKFRYLVPAEDETTEAVREIFRLYIEGWGMAKIASYLNGKGIAPPSSHIKNFGKSKYGMWSANTIRYILTNPKYSGSMIQGITKRVSYKLKKSKPVSEEHQINGGEFKGIIPKRKFDLVQTLIEKRRKTLRYWGDNIHLFTGVLVCNECGSPLCYRKEFKGYKCSVSQRVKGKCTAHSVKEERLKRIIIDELMNFSKRLDTLDYYSEAERLANIKRNNNKKDLAKIEEEINDIKEKINIAYIDKLDGNISGENFQYIVKSLEDKKDKLKKKHLEIKKQLSKEENQSEKITYYKKMIDDFLEFKEFDRGIVETLIDKIVVSENKETKQKKLDIYFTFSNNSKN